MPRLTRRKGQGEEAAPDEAGKSEGEPVRQRGRGDLQSGSRAGRDGTRFRRAVVQNAWLAVLESEGGLNGSRFAELEFDVPMTGG